MGFSVQDSELVYRKKLVVKTEGRILFLDQDEILWLEAEGNYVQIHTDHHHVSVRCGISILEKELSLNFLRISRSAIVNLNYVKEMQPWLRGNYRVIMSDNSQLTLTHSYRDRLDQLIGTPLGTRTSL